jgi:hypothetical protein
MLHNLLFILFGFSLPFIIFLSYCGYHIYTDNKEKKEYARCYDKYTSEYDNLTQNQKDFFLLSKEEYGRQFSSERDRYFWIKYNSAIKTDSYYVP